MFLHAFCTTAILKNFMSCDWLVGLSEVTGKYGHLHLVLQSSFHAVQAKGSIDTLLNGYIQQVVFLMYPNIKKKVEFNENGNLLRGPVVLNVDAGPG